MSFITTIKRLEYINYLLKTKSTGNLETLARKCNLSKRAMTDLLNLMREIGAEINYDRSRQTYFYTEPGEIISCRFMKYGQILAREEIAKIGKPEDLCFSEKAIFIKCEDL